MRVAIVFGLLTAAALMPASAAEPADGLRTVRLACDYTGATTGPLQITLFESGARAVVMDGDFVYRGEVDPYQVEAFLEPPVDQPGLAGSIKINRTTGLVEKIIIAAGAAPLVMHARCRHAKPKF